MGSRLRNELHPLKLELNTYYPLTITMQNSFLRGVREDIFSHAISSGFRGEKGWMVCVVESFPQNESVWLMGGFTGFAQVGLLISVSMDKFNILTRSIFWELEAK